MRSLGSISDSKESMDVIVSRLGVHPFGGAASDGLAAMGPVAIPALIDATRDESKARDAIGTLGRMGKDALPTVPALMDLLRAGGPVDMISEALFQIAPHAEDTVSALRAHWESIPGPAASRRNAAQRKIDLARMSEDDPRWLVWKLQHRERQREEAIAELVALGSAVEAGIPALRHILSGNADANAKVAACVALGRIRNRHAHACARELAKLSQESKWHDVRIAATWALRKLCSKQSAQR